MAIPKEVGRRELGIAGALIIAAEILSSGYSNRDLSSKLDALQKTVVETRIEREQFFVRKTELVRISKQIEDLTKKVDSIAHNFSQSHSPSCSLARLDIESM